MRGRNGRVGGRGRKRIPAITALVAAAVGATGAVAPVAGQFAGGAPAITAQGVTLGAGAGFGMGQATRRGDRAWHGGPTLALRGNKAWETTGLGLMVDVQAFQLGARDVGGDYWAAFLLPTATFRAAGGVFRVGIGVVKYTFEEPDPLMRTTWGVALGASVSRALSRSYLVEFSFRRGESDRGFRSILYSLQLIRRWSL